MGKSFLIKAIKLLVGKIWPSKVTVALAEPTGLAAFKIGGLTIHRLFQLPIEHKWAEYWCRWYIHGVQSHIDVHAFETGRATLR